MQCMPFTQALPIALAMVGAYAVFLGIRHLMKVTANESEIELESRPSAPKILRDPTVKETQYFINEYFPIGPSPDSKVAKDYTANLAKTLRIADARLIKIESDDLLKEKLTDTLIDKGIIQEDTGIHIEDEDDFVFATLAGDDGEMYEHICLCSQYGANIQLRKDIEMVIFCAVDESGSEKIITAAPKFDVEKK